MAVPLEPSTLTRRPPRGNSCRRAAHLRRCHASAASHRAGARRPAERLIAIRPAVPEDAASLAGFGARIFRETFGADNTPENMALYLEANYRPERQEAEIRDPGIVTLVVEDGRRLAGFVQLREGPAPDSVSGEAPIEIWRFYVDRAWHGRGVAQSLMMASLEAAMARGARTVWLCVWERNLRAQAFYRKCGFEDRGAKAFMLGEDRQIDRVMVRVV